MLETIRGGGGCEFRGTCTTLIIRLLIKRDFSLLPGDRQKKSVKYSVFELKLYLCSRISSFFKACEAIQHAKQLI